MRRALVRHLWLQTGLWLLIAVVANHLAAGAFARLDLTADQRHTLSDAARRAVSDLDRPMVARVFFTGDLEAPYHDHERVVLDTLAELGTWSGGRLDVRVSDPSRDPDARRDADAYGIEPVQYRYRDRSRREVREVHLGLALVYGGRHAVVSPIANLDTLEYELVRAIRGLTVEGDDRGRIGWLQGFGAPDLAGYPSDDPFGRLRDELATTADLVPVPLGGADPLPDDLDALLVIGPQEPLTERAVWQLDQLLIRGTSVGLFVSSVRPDWTRFRMTPLDHGLTGWLARQGVTVGREVVADRKHNEVANLPLAPGSRPVPVRHPLVPVASSLDPGAPPVSGLDRVVLPFASPVGLADPLPAGVDGREWIESSPASVATSTLPALDAGTLSRPLHGERPGPVPVAVGLVGAWQSAFVDRPIPTPPGRDAPLPGDETVVDGAPARLVVVGSADMVANNPAFVLNTVDWMLQDDALVAIRSRTASEGAFTPPDPASAWRWKLGIALGPLLPLLALGLAVGLRGRR